jgi:hypothetical protein
MELFSYLTYSNYRNIRWITVLSYTQAGILTTELPTKN